MIEDLQKTKPYAPWYKYDPKVRYCTIPSIFGLEHWFTKRFNDLCFVHDYEYINQYGSKWRSDMNLLKGFWRRGHPWLAIITFPFLMTVGLYMWYM